MALISGVSDTLITDLSFIVSLIEVNPEICQFVTISVQFHPEKNHLDSSLLCLWCLHISLVHP